MDNNTNYETFQGLQEEINRSLTKHPIRRFNAPDQIFLMQDGSKNDDPATWCFTGEICADYGLLTLSVTYPEQLVKLAAEINPKSAFDASAALSDKEPSDALRLKGFSLIATAEVADNLEGWRLNMSQPTAPHLVWQKTPAPADSFNTDGEGAVVEQILRLDAYLGQVSAKIFGVPSLRAAS